MLAALSRLLPPPTYLSMSCLGVDISDTSLKYVRFEPTVRPSGERVLDTWGDITIPSGAMARGKVNEPQQLVAVLEELKATTGAEFVRVSLPEERAYLFETSIKANTPLKEVRALLEFRLEENVPMPSRETYFDFMILEGGSERKTNVAVAAYARETIQTYYDACATAGLRPVSFEVEAQAMARAVVPHSATGVTMLVDFGKTRTGVGIVLDGILLYTSTIDIGGERLSSALRKVVGVDTGEAELTKLKNTVGLQRGVESADVHDTLINAVSIIKDELATRMQYWHLRSGNDPERRISNIILCGGSSNLKGLPAYLSETLGVSAQRANVWENTFSLEDTVPPIDRRHSFGYATAIGLALKSTI